MKTLIARSLILLLISATLCSCKMDTRESFRLTHIYIRVYDLLPTKESGQFFPVKYDETRTNDLCLFSFDSRFEFIDSTEDTCPLEPGCGYSLDSIISIQVIPETLILDTTFNNRIVLINERAGDQPLPYNPNEIRLKNTLNFFNTIHHISQIQLLKKNYNTREIKNHDLLFYDNFFFCSKEVLQAVILQKEHIQFLVVTTMQSIEINFKKL